MTRSPHTWRNARQRVHCNKGKGRRSKRATALACKRARTGACPPPRANYSDTSVTRCDAAFSSSDSPLPVPSVHASTSAGAGTGASAGTGHASQEKAVPGPANELVRHSTSQVGKACRRCIRALQGLSALYTSSIPSSHQRTKTSVLLLSPRKKHASGASSQPFRS